jgi:hypothetical protein
MTRFRRTLRQTFTIARRDFIATVFTPIFLLFLFAPVIMGSFGAIGGMGAASVSGGAQDKTPRRRGQSRRPIHGCAACSATTRPLQG